MQNVKMIHNPKAATVSEALGVMGTRGDEIIKFAEHVVASGSKVSDMLDAMKEYAHDRKEVYYGSYVIGAALSKKRTTSYLADATSKIVIESAKSVEIAYDLYRSETKRTRSAEGKELYMIFVAFASVCTGYFIDKDLMVTVFALLAWLPMILQALWWIIRMIGKVIVWILAAIYTPFLLVYLLIKRYMRNKRTAEEKA